MNTADHAKVTDPFRRMIYGLIRRMVVTLSGGATDPRWQLLGVRTLAGDDERVIAEPFLGIGFYARPESDGKPEAIVVNVGGANAPAVIAVRDEKTRKAIANAIKAGETMIFNARACIYLKDDGTIEIRAPGGSAEPLVKRSEFSTHTHGYTDDGTPSITGGPTAAIAGTTVLKGQ